MQQKKWKEKIGGNSGLIIIGAFIVLSIILTADHLFNLPHLLIKISTGRFEWNELILDLVAIFVIGVISISLIRKSELKQKEMESGLKDREPSYRELAESITDVFFAFDKELRYTYWNKASENLTGISAKDAIGKSLYDLFPMTEETKKAEEVYLEVLRTQKPRSFENQYQIEGKNFCFEICAYPSKDGLSIFVKDITEHKKTEEELIRLSTAVKMSTDGIVICDLEGKIIDINEATLKMYQTKDRNDFIGKNYLNFIASEEQGRALEGMEEVMQKGSTKNYEFNIVTRKGDIISVEINTALMKDVNGKPIGLVATIRDITDRKKAEESLKESEERFRQLAENIDQVFWLTDWDAKRLLYVNPAYERLYGRSCQCAYDNRMSWQDVIHPDDRARVKEAFSRSADLSQYVEAEYRIVHDDGTERWVLDRSYPIRDKYGKTDRFASVAEDITERKKAEELLRTSEAQLSNAMKITKLGYWEYDVAKDLFTFNDHFYAIFRTTAEKVGGYTMSSARYAELFVHPDDISLVGIEIRKALETTDPNFSRQLEHRIIYADGETGYITVRFFIIKDDKGNTVRTYGANQDITERKKVEEELRASESKYKTLLENLPQKIFFKDKNLVYVSCNENYARDLKIKPNMIIGKTDYDFYPESLAEKYRADDKRIMQIGKTEDLEEEYPQEEQKVFVHTFKTPVKDEEGNIIGVLGIFWDITERKKAEETLKESEERYRNFFENAALGIYRTTPDGRILLANPALVQMLGYSSFEELASRNLEEEGFEPQYSRNKFKESLEKTSEVQALESAWLRRDGSTIFVRENARAVRKEDGSILYYEGMAEDITERKKAEEALRTSEEKYRAIVENATDQIFTLDRKCRFLSINKKAAEISRKSVSEMVGKSLLQIFPKETASQFSKNIEEVFEAGQSKFIEERMCLGGKEFYSSSTLNPIKDDTGNVVAVTGIVRDITERKKAEEAIRASLDRYRSYIEATGQLGWTTSADGEVVEDIPSWRAYTGLSYEEIKGWGWSNALHPDDLEYTTQIWKKAVAARTLYEVEYRLRRHDGVYRHFMARGLPVLDEDGSIREWVGTCIDITERKKAGEALRESEQRYRGVVDNIGIGVSLISPNLEILFLNNQMKKWFPNADISKEATCYRAFNSPPKEEACSYCPTNKTLQDGQIHESITDTPAGDKIINYRVISSPIKDLQGNVIAAIEMVEDITEKKRLQEQLIQTEKLAAVGTLAYGIAHEFNNILAGMMANAELGLISKEHKQIKECFEIIVDNSKRASSITNNLLAFARHKEARKELIDITESLKSVLAIIHRELEKNNIEIIEKFRPIPKIYCDPGQFSEVFLNMITNARDAMHPKGGRLTIQVESAGDCIRMIFKDTGCGIPEEIKGRIFEPFVTTKGALGKSEIPGTGLGLFLSYGIIDGYQGKIMVESKVGKGTKFTILISVSKNQPRELLLNTRIESSKETEKKLKILLVDDEKAITLGLKKFLESKGHRVSTSLRAKQGLEIFRKGRFDLVLSDITIPDMDGIELIKKVKEKDPQAKIIVITGHLQKEKEEKARQAGADEVLIKPFRNELLYQTISKVIV